MKNLKNLPLRIGVGIILLNAKKQVFVGKRIDNPKKFWQMPQGGVDQNESFLEAAKRELEEETGIKTVKIIKELNYWLEYELPDHLLGKILQGYKGQKQKWFIMKFIGKIDEINVKTKKPEFIEWKWIDIQELPKIVVDFKIEVYKKLQIELASLKLS